MSFHNASEVTENSTAEVLTHDALLSQDLDVRQMLLAHRHPTIEDLRVGIIRRVDEECELLGLRVRHARRQASMMRNKLY